MCLRSNKMLFASSFAMQGLVFLIASNSEGTVSIVNGLQGGQLGDVSTLQKDLRNIRSNDYFLDNVTGDLYCFSYDSGEWVSKGNAGIHYRRAAEEFKTLGKYIIKAPQYKSKRINDIDQPIASKLNETICTVRKSHMHHYLFDSFPTEFLVPFLNAWDVHPFNFTNPKRTFQTLADSPKGPTIIDISDNIVAVQFGIEKKYPETVQVLKNYVKQQIAKLCAHKNTSLPIEVVSIKLNENALDQLLEQQARNKYSKKQDHHQQNIKFNVITEFHHAGYAAKKTDTIALVLNNAIGKGVMRQASVSQLPLESSRDQLRQTSIYSIHITNKNMDTVKTLPDDQQQQPTYYKTKKEITLMLHPNIDQSILPKSRHIWVPGALSQTINSASNPEVSGNEVKKIIVKPTINKLSSSIITHYTPNQQFIRSSSPYITYEELHRQRQKEEDKKILAQKLPSLKDYKKRITSKYESA